MAKAKEIALRALKTLLLPIIVYILFAVVLAPGRFGSANGLYVSLVQAVVPTLLGWGLCMNMMVGAFDFSGGATVYLAAMVGAYASQAYGIAGMIIACILCAFVLEIITGAIFTVLKIPSIITTIGMLLVYESMTQIYHGGNNAYLADGAGLLGKSPYIFIVCLGAGVLFHLIYNYTKMGFNVRAVGNNSSVAKNIGINARNVKFQCFVIAGIFMGLAAIIQLSYGGLVSAKANMATLELTFTPIMGVVLGMQLAPYCGMAIGVLVGEFTINMITSGLIGMGLSGNAQKIVTGIALLAVLIAVSVKGKFSERQAYKALVKTAEGQTGVAE